MFNFRLPEHLIERVDRVVEKGKRTEFVEQAIDEKLAQREGVKPFKCPVDDCDFRTATPGLQCLEHGETVVREGTLL